MGANKNIADGLLQNPVYTSNFDDPPFACKMFEKLFVDVWWGSKVCHRAYIWFVQIL